MSTTIDERVVEMRFDNKQFEQNVQTSISTIEKLEKSLNLKGASKGLEDVKKKKKNCNMTPLSNAVETVKMRFSALEVMAVTALANITNSALNAGKNIVSALTIDPIKTGFQEYETQINAVQTILANTQSKGTTIDQVNAALDELNKYADQTIYNFTEMTRNIGTFTAAGVDLDKSVTSIKGIANLAAASGSNAYQASTAMYQLSQAIAAGKVAAANIDEYLGFNHHITVDVDIPAARLTMFPASGRVNTTERDAGERNRDFNLIECGLTHEEAMQESSRCLRCDHYGYGNFKGGRVDKW